MALGQGSSTFWVLIPLTIFTTIIWLLCIVRMVSARVCMRAVVAQTPPVASCGAFATPGALVVRSEDAAKFLWSRRGQVAFPRHHRCRRECSLSCLA